MTNEKNLKKLLGDDYEKFLVFRDTKWVGSFTIEQLMSNCMNDVFRPSASNSVYLVSKEPWESHPSGGCDPLYVGGSTQLRFRIGDLIADMLGFFPPRHHPGGQSLYDYCKRNSLSPLYLHIGWLDKCGCTECAEYYFWEELEPELNVRAPQRKCKHVGKGRYLSIVPR
jgi:hypothetical protein